MSTLSVPGPRPMLLLGASGRLARFALDPLRYVGELFERFGNIAALVEGRPSRVVSTQPNVPGTVFILGPELNRAVLGAHERFHKCALSGPLYPSEPLTARTQPLRRLLTGLFHVNGSEHREQRRLLMPAFHKSRIESYRDDMVAITSAILDEFRLDEVRDLQPDMMELTLRVATKTLFGSDFGEQGLEIGRELGRWLELFRPSAVLPWDLPGMPYRRWLNLSLSLDARMARIIREKQRLGSASDDMLSMLLEATYEGGARLSEDELIGHAGVIFAAGHETSSNALCWTLFLLSQHPEIAAQLIDELSSKLGGGAPSVGQLSELRFLDQVVKESLRLFPPAPLNHRLAAQDCELGGYRLPVGTEVLSSVYHTHRMPGLYTDPVSFRPERWQAFDPGPYAYNPFGAGPRMCIGAPFALMEIKIVLALLLQRFSLELVANQRIDRFFSITLAPKHGLRMRIRRRNHSVSADPPRVRGNVHEMVKLPRN